MVRAGAEGRDILVARVARGGFLDAGALPTAEPRRKTTEAAPLLGRLVLVVRCVVGSVLLVSHDFEDTYSAANVGCSKPKISAAFR